MVGKALFMNLLWRFILLIATSLGIAVIAFRILDKESVFTLVVGVILLFIQIYLLSRYVMRVHSTLVTFIDSVGMGSASELYLRELDPAMPGLEKRLNELKAQVSRSRFEQHKQMSLLNIVVDSMDTGLICINQDEEVVFSNESARSLIGAGSISDLGDIGKHDPSLAMALKDSVEDAPRLISLPRFKASVRSKQFVLDKKDHTLFSVQNIQREVDAQETETWQKLIRVLTHEIMNCMGPILSLSKSLKNSTKQPDKLVAGLTAIENTGEGLMHFIREYRRLSTLPPPKKKMIRVSQLFEQVQSLYSEDFAGRKIQLEVNIEKPGLALYADPHQVEQVLINLIKNASESLKDTGSGKIELKAVYDSGSTIIQVKDNGPGIPEKIKDQVFIPFYSTKTNGTGIGLSLARQIMINHDGTIQFSSIPDKETEFTLSFHASNRHQ